MEKIKIITDSTCDLPSDIVIKHDIEKLPLLVNIGDETYADGVDLNLNLLMSKMKETEEFPTTTQINPQRFFDTYKKYLDEGYKIVSIHLSSNMSGTYQSACIAKDMLETKDVIVIDSRNVTCGLGLLVIKACKLRDEGLNIYEIEEKIKEVIPHVKSSLVFGSLDNLVKGGRLSKTAGVIGNLLGIKLVLDVSDGEMNVREKVRGSKKAVRKAVDYIKERGVKKDEECILIKTGDEELEELIRPQFAELRKEFIEANVGCVVGVHSGPTASGVFFIEEY